MVSEFSPMAAGGGIAIGAGLAWRLVTWFAQRDRQRVEQDIRDLWKELNKTKGEVVDLGRQVASLPGRPEFQRLEEKLDAIGDRILDALRSTRH